MALAKWTASDGVGFSKKHDAPGTLRHGGSSRSLFGNLRRRRLMLIIAALLALYLFVKNIPTDLPPVSRRYNPTLDSPGPGHNQGHLGSHHPTEGNTKKFMGEGYDGSISLPNLVTTLRSHVSQFNNNNVLIALPDLASTSNLIPLACQMARNNRTSVHVAMFGRQEFAVEEIVKIHGLSAEDCPVTWHDGRPDRPMDSSRARIETSIEAGFAHCVVALQPRVAIVDDRFDMKIPLGKVLQRIATQGGTTLLTVPDDLHSSLPWIANLDGSSISKLRVVEVEIVVQAYSESAGSLIRLLRSIANAAYKGLYIPRLTIELPPHIDPFLLGYLEKFKWPPDSMPSESRLTLRRRIDTKRLDKADASLRTVETFYPHTSDTSHILLLSPDAELSPSYLHYLMFTLLEYKYGQDHQGLSQSLFGISLDLPSETLNGHRPFWKADKNPIILSQAPNNNAALVMGDKWSDLHTFLTERLTRDPGLAQQSNSAPIITQKYPHWLAEALEMMQIKGQYMVYPAFAAKQELRLVTLHEEMHQAPEEYDHVDKDQKHSTSVNQDSIMHDDVLTGEIDLQMSNDNIAPLTVSLPMQILLGHEQHTGQQGLPRLSDIPLFTFTGEATSWTRSRLAAVESGEKFSLHQGGCPSLEARNTANSNSIRYFFCEVD